MIKEIFGMGIDPKSVEFIHMISGGGNITLASEGANGHVVFKSFTPAERKHMPGWLARWENRGRRIGVCSQIINRQLGDERPEDADFIGLRWFIARLPLGELDVLKTVKPATFTMRTSSAIVAGWKLQFGIGFDEAKLAGEVILELLPCADLARFCDVPGFNGAELLSCNADRVYHKSVFLPKAKEVATPFTTPQETAPKARIKAPSGQAVMLGNHEDGGQVHWAPFEAEAKLLNFGVLVTGDPGAGKTETLKVLISGVARMGFPVCIFDFKNDYAEKGFVQANKLKVHDVRRKGLPFNPLMPSAGEGAQIQPIEHIFTIAGVFKRVFALGDRQTAVLRDAISEAFLRRGIDPKKWVDVSGMKPPCFDDVIHILEERRDDKDREAISLIDRISPLFELGLFPRSSSSSFEAMIDSRIVLGLSELPTDEIKAALAELIIIRLHGVLLRRQQPRKLTRLIVVDEAWRIATSKHLENLAREGRAFGAGIAIGTQFPGDLPADFSGALDTKIFLKNQQPDHRRAVIKALCGGQAAPEASNMQSTLEGLRQFEGLIQNQQHLPYARFKLVPYFSREHAPVPDLPGVAWDAIEPEAEDEYEPMPRMQREAPARPQGRQEEQGVDVKRWLEEQLANGATPLVILTKAAADAGISRTRLNRAASKLRVAVKPIPGAANNAKQWEINN